MLTRKLSDKKKFHVECNHCQAKYELSSVSKNRFTIIDLKYQLKLFLKDTEIKTNLLDTIKKLKLSKNDDVICAVYDGQLYKNVQKVSPGALTMLILMAPH